MNPFLYHILLWSFFCYCYIYISIWCSRPMSSFLFFSRQGWWFFDFPRFPCRTKTETETGLGGFLAVREGSDANALSLTRSPSKVSIDALDASSVRSNSDLQRKKKKSSGLCHSPQTRLEVSASPVLMTMLTLLMADDVPSLNINISWPPRREFRSLLRMIPYGYVRNSHLLINLLVPVLDHHFILLSGLAISAQPVITAVSSPLT
jgi:hypothetical protein